MATATEESRRSLIDAREHLAEDLDEFSSAVRSAVDIPAKIRRNPLQTAGLAAGAGFLALGGPKRVLRGVVHRVRPQTRRPHEGLLPKDIEKVVKKRTGERSTDVQTALEND